ncbi:MAG: hypothetical protein HY273_08845 [Gammaproteobacteria bacterium]|nr:hypothetical protein [Gammaproteobacteria bacterium]
MAQILGMKILIAGDEPNTSTYLKQGLAEAGFIADLVADGVVAVIQQL